MRKLPMWISYCNGTELQAANCSSSAPARAVTAAFSRPVATESMDWSVALPWWLQPNKPKDSAVSRVTSRPTRCPPP
jgi:hypothetical protein